MHLLREGDFSVASQFHTDASSKQPIFERQTEQGFIATETQSGLGIEDLRSENLRKQFGNMYHILEEMRKKRNLLPAIAWAETRRQQLDQRGSNLEFELQRLQFVWLFNRSFNSRDPRSLQDCQRQAIDYARQEFDHFQGRYLREIQQLIGAMAFSPNLRDSPYHNTFLDDDQWEHLATSFTREFCSLLGLSAESPLYIAATVGTIALPNLLKYQSIKGGPDREYQWTTSAELSVNNPATFVIHHLTLLGGNSSPNCLPIPLHLRLPCLKRANHGRKSPYDDALRTRRRSRNAVENEQRI